MSSKQASYLPQQSSRKARSQSCLELQEKQLLHVSVSTLSLPPALQTSLRPKFPSSPSLQPLTHSNLAQRLRKSKTTKSSRLRVHSAPTGHAEPDYEQMARKRKESELLTKSVTAESLLKGKVPEGESLHSFIIGGRYNSTHHMDSRSLHRLGVYVPRDNSSKAFINPAGTIPPSPAVYGIHPLKKHLPLVFPNSSTATPCFSTGRYSADIGRSLISIENDLDRQLNNEGTASSCSLLSDKVCDLSSPESVENLSTEVERRSVTNGPLNKSVKPHLDNDRDKQREIHHQMHKDDDCERQEKREGEKRRSNEDITTSDIRVSGTKDYTKPVGNKEQCSVVVEREAAEAAVEGDDHEGNEGSDSVVVSVSDLLSPEAQLLTQEILLETTSMCSTKSTESTVCRYNEAARPFDKQIFFPNTDSHQYSDTKQIFSHTECKSSSTRKLATEHPHQQLRHESHVAECLLERKTDSMQLTVHVPRRHKLSEVVSISRHNSTALPTRPRSALCEGQGMTQKTDSSFKRPQSAMQISKKPGAEQKKSCSTIFIDLSKLTN